MASSSLAKKKTVGGEREKQSVGTVLMWHPWTPTTHGKDSGHLCMQRHQTHVIAHVNTLNSSSAGEVEAI